MTSPDLPRAGWREQTSLVAHPVGGGVSAGIICRAEQAGRQTHPSPRKRGPAGARCPLSLLPTPVGLQHPWRPVS